MIACTRARDAAPTQRTTTDSMDQHLITRIVEAALLAANQPLTLAQLHALFPLDEPAPDGSVETGAGDPARRLRRPRRRTGRTRLRLPLPGQGRRARLGRAAVDRAPDQVHPRHAGNAGADRLPPADHPRRDRAGPRRGGQQQHHQGAGRARVDPRGRPPRRARQAGAVRHHQGASSTTSASSAWTNCRRCRSSRTSANSNRSSSSTANAADGAMPIGDVAAAMPTTTTPSDRRRQTPPCEATIDDDHPTRRRHDTDAPTDESQDESNDTAPIAEDDDSRHGALR